MRNVLVVLALGACFVSAGCETSPEPPAAGKQTIAGDFREIVKSAKAKVFPAVVFIQVLQESLEGGKKITQPVVGSGVLITPDGQVVSNWHVVE